MVIFSDKQVKELNDILSYALSKGYKAKDLEDYVSIAEKINKKKEADEFDDENDSKIFVVTSGEYSDYTINKVFSNEKEAQKYLDTSKKMDNYEEYRIEEYDLLEKSTLKEIIYIHAIYEVIFKVEKGNEKDQEKADKLNAMINGRGATDGEKENAKRLLEKLKKKKSIDKTIEVPKYRFDIESKNNEDYTEDELISTEFSQHIGTNRRFFSFGPDDTDYSNNSIIIKRVISQKNYDEEKLKAKYKQVCLDLYYQIKYLQEHDHLSETQINDLLKNKSISSKVEE